MELDGVSLHQKKDTFEKPISRNQGPVNNPQALLGALRDYFLSVPPYRKEAEWTSVGAYLTDLAPLPRTA